MGNRSYLYVRTDDTHQAIAEANNDIPLLWQLLLAGGQADDAIRDQRILRVADEDTTNLAVPLADAVQRAHRVLAFAARHPMGAELPHLARYAEAAHAYLQQWLDAYGPSAALSADLDEMAWFESDYGEPGFNDRYLARLRGEFAALWHSVDNAMAQRDWRAFDVALAETHDTAAAWSRDWSQWQWHLGLASFDHPYFSEDYVIHDQDFATFCAEGHAEADELDEVNEVDDADSTDEADDEAAEHLHGDLWRFGKAGTYGVRRGSAPDAPVLLAAVYEDMTLLDHASEGGLLCCQRDGLLWIVDASAMPVRQLNTVGYDEIWDSTEGLMPFRQGSRFGFLRVDGSELVSACYDDVHGFAGGIAAVQLGGRFGFIDRDGRQFVDARYLDVELLAAPEERYLRKVRLETGWGIMGCDAQLLLPCDYDEIDWLSDVQGWVAGKDGQWTLLRADGTPWAGPAPYRVIGWQVEDICLRITQDERLGLLAADGTLQVPCRYQELVTLNASPQRPLFFCREEEDGPLNVMDRQGVPQLPMACAEIDAFAILREELAATAQWHDLLRVQVDAARPDSVGVWRVGDAQPLIPCEYDDVRIVLLDAQAAAIAFVTERADASEASSHDDALRVGVRRADGTPLHPEVYGWIGVKRRLREGCWGASQVVDTLEREWQQGAPVEAWNRQDEGLYWLDADGGSQPFERGLRQRAAAGDWGAVQRLANACGTGDQVARNVPEAVCLYTRLAQSPEADTALRGLACYRLALLLCDDTSGVLDYAAALGWLQQAVEWLTDDAARGHACRWLVYLYDNALGTADDPAAMLRYATLSSECGDGAGSRRAGTCWHTGRGCTADLDRAKDFYEQAIGQGYAPARTWLADVLCDLAEQRSAPAYYRLAEYHLREALRHEDSPAWAGTLLARLSLDGKLPEPLADVEALLLSAAEAGDVQAMGLLARRVYPSGDARQQHWAARWQQAQAEEDRA